LTARDAARTSRLGLLTPKGYREGTHRLVDPDETVARLSPHLGALGITRVANVTGLDRVGLPVVMVCRPNSCSLAVYQGKGLTLAAARASGLMEAAEIAHGERVILPRSVTTYARLRRSAAVVDVARVPRRRGADVHHRPIPWVQGRDMLTEEPIWVPYELIHTRYTVRHRRSRCFASSTNGLASGNCWLEALSHALCEVIERDAFSHWIRLPRAAQDRTRLDLATVEDAANRELLGLFEAADVAVAVWELTSGNGVPVFGCQIQDRDLTHQGRVAATWGYGCHPTRGVALSRALTEAAQSRLTWIAGSRDDIGRDMYARHLAEGEVERERSYFEVRGPMRRFADAPTFEADTFDEDVAWLLSRLTATGIRQVAAVDLTLPEFQIPVVRVVVPGLEAGTDPGQSSAQRRRLRARIGLSK
jgi:YcaO-like protein with predicted kinase domain